MGKFDLLSERLNWAVEQKLQREPVLRKITNASIGKVAGVSPPAVGYWFADKNGIDAEQARKVGAFLGVDAVWLEKGEGKPYRSGFANLPIDKQAALESIEEIDEMERPERPIVTRSAYAGIAPGYIRLERLSPRPSMGPGAEVSEPIQVVHHLEVQEQWARKHVGVLDHDRVKVLAPVGDSMAPTIKEGDLVFVDIGHRHLDAPGIYVIDVAGRLLLKKVMIRADGTVVIRSDNTASYPDEEQYPIEQAEQVITICGKVLAWWALRKT